MGVVLSKAIRAPVKRPRDARPPEGVRGGRPRAAHGLGSAVPMARLSEYLLPTEEEAPADAEAISHKLMVRAGLVRQMGAGLWTWLPAGWRVHQRVVAIIREEMDAIGAPERSEEDT